MKKGLVFVLLLVAVVFLFADDSWFIIKPGKMVSSGGFMTIVSGSPTAMVSLGMYEDSQGNGTLEGTFVNDGYNFYPIPRELSGTSIMTEGFLTSTVFMDKDNIGGIREKFEGEGFGTTLVTAFVTANIFTMHMLNIVHVFDAKPQIAGESLLYNNGVLYIGTYDGQILTSSDNGKSWTTQRVSVSDEVQIKSIFALSDTHLIAAGGASEEDVLEETIVVLPIGGVWESTDGGLSWTPLTNDRKIVPVDVIKTASGRIYLQYMNEQDVASSQNPLPTRLGVTDDNFTTFIDEFQVTANTGKALAGKATVDYKSGITWIVGVASDFSPLTVRSKDEGATWIEYFLPPLGEGMLVTPAIVHIFDEHHVYAGFTNTAIAKFGDINEDYSAIPDETETSDADVTETTDRAETEDKSAATDSEIADSEMTDESSETPDSITVADEGCSMTIID